MKTYTLFRNSTSQSKWLNPIFTLMILMGVIQFGFSQCPSSLGCNDRIQISLGFDCNACLTPELILEDERDGCDYTVEILTANDLLVATTDKSGATPVYPCVDGSFIGQDWKASVSFVDGNNTVISCWGYFTVEDKLPPTITCIDDITVDCAEDLSDLLTSSTTSVYTYESLVDDGDASTTVIRMCTTNAPNGWELVESMTISPATGSGSVSGSILMNGETSSLSIDNTSITGNIIGAQAGSDGCLEITLPSSEVSDADATSVELSAEFISFHDFQVTDNCDPDLEVLITYDETQQLDCANNLTGQRTIRYYTSDNAGLSANFCEFSIFFTKKDLSDIVFPDNYYVDCQMAPASLDPGTVVGIPTIDGQPIEGGDNLCRINVTFADDTFNLCGVNSIKILRQWTALDWCAGQYSQSFQTIKVEDTLPPVVSCPPDTIKVVATDNCLGDLELDPLGSGPTALINDIDNCDNVSLVIAEFLKADERDPNAVDQPFNPATPLGNNKFLASGLQGGFNWLKYIVEDDCGRRSECRFEIEVTNDKAPTPVCDQFTVVSLDNSGWGRVYAPSVDDGSFDDCGGQVDLAIKRDSAPCSSQPESSGNDLQFGDFVQFCCQEAGDTVKVTLRATGPTGKSNTCDAYVVIQDKSGFGITCPTVLTANLDCSQINDIGTDVFGEAMVSDDCGAGSIRFQDSNNFDAQCGSGTVTRTWFLDLGGQTQTLGQCEQTFNFSSDVNLTENDFEWPADRNDATCMNFNTDLGDAPKLNGAPVNEAAFCGDLTYSYSDLVFENVEGYCVKVIRTWTVIDWCLHNANQNTTAGKWSRVQIVKVSNNTGPMFDNVPEDVTLEIGDNTCEATISFDAPTAVDLCKDESIDSDDISWSISGINRSGNGNISNVKLSPGSYTVTWNTSGICGQDNTVSHEITVNDIKSPTPYCLGGVTTVLMTSADPNEDPFVTIWSNDFDLGSTDNCGDVTFSFSETSSETSMTFTCDDLGDMTLDIWVSDESGNQDFCQTTISIQANGGICDDAATGMRIAGDIHNENFEVVEGMMVHLMKMEDQTVKNYITDINGEFAFNDNADYEDYQLYVKGQDDYLNGVSTLDIIHIQRHILGSVPLTSPYKIVAADVDNSRSVTALDLIELRKLILGIYNVLPQNESWRFIDSEQSFADVNSPWPLKEEINIYNLSSDMSENDFVAVKVGDVNGSAVVELGNQSIDKRNLSSINFKTEALELNNEGEYLVPIYLEDLTTINGFQLRIDLGKNLKLIEVDAGKVKLNASHYHLNKDILSIAWHDSNALEVKNNEALFYLTLQTSDNEFEGLKMLESYRNEIYDSNLDVYALKFEGVKTELSRNKLYQNTPNPFSDNTNIEFELAKDGNVEILIYDMNGQLVKRINEFMIKGMNAISLKSKELNGVGIYYYHLKTADFSASKKMIHIQ